MHQERRPLLACGFALLALFSLAWAWRLATPEAGEASLGGSALATSLFVASLAIAGALMRRASLGDTLGLLPGRMGMGRLIIVAVGTVGLSHLCGELLRQTPLFERSLLHTLETALAGLGGGALLLAIAGFVVAPAISEELMFRGFVFRTLRIRVGPGLAILFSSILFGAAHLDVGQAVATSVLGVYLGTLAFASGSTRGPIGCHMLNNGIALTTLVFSEASETAPQTGADLPGMLLAGTAALAGALVLVRSLPNPRPGGPKGQGDPPP